MSKQIACDLTCVRGPAVQPGRAELPMLTHFLRPPQVPQLGACCSFVVTMTYPGSTS
jgi:hypothetical protein